MIENIYSSREFQGISEVPFTKEIHLDLLEAGFVENEIHGLLLDKTAKFGILAPFWIPNFLARHSDIKTLDEYVQNLIEQCSRYAHHIEIRLAPSFYNSNIDTLKYLLLKNGFKVSDIATWQCISISKFYNELEYESSLKHSSRKVINNFKKNYLSSMKEIDLDDAESIELAYCLINDNRKTFGANLKYSFDYLLSLIRIEPTRIKIFTFNVDEYPVAAAICHMTDKNVLYVAAWGDANHELTQSPMYLFASCLVKFCLDNRIQFLDFGISCTLAEYTPGLFSFKKNIGCFSTLQETFVYKKKFSPNVTPVNK
jgi:hypothetical protein